MEIKQIMKEKEVNGCKSDFKATLILSNMDSFILWSCVVFGGASSSLAQFLCSLLDFLKLLLSECFGFLLLELDIVLHVGEFLGDLLLLGGDDLPDFLELCLNLGNSFLDKLLALGDSLFVLLKMHFEFGLLLLFHIFESFGCLVEAVRGLLGDCDDGFECFLSELLCNGSLVFKSLSILVGKVCLHCSFSFVCSG